MGQVQYCVGVFCIVLAGCGGGQSVTRWQVYEAVVGGHAEQRIQILAEVVDGKRQAKSVRVKGADGIGWRLDVQGDDPAFWQTYTLPPTEQRHDVSVKRLIEGESVGEAFWADVDHLLPSIQPPASQLAGRVIDREQAIAIAKLEVTANETWADRASYEAHIIQDGQWAVTAWRIEPGGCVEYGGDRFIIIDRDGRVADYVRGH